MNRHLSLSFALVLALPTVACVDSAGSDSQDVSSAIEQPNGGLDMTDEAPEFGAQTDLAAAAIEADAAVTDPLASDPATVEMDRASAGRGYRAVILWGKMPADRTTEAPRDWSGSLKLSHGGMIVRRTIAFEDRGDQLLPRTAIDTVAFKSVTRPHVDGLALTVLEPSATTEPQTLTYTPDDGGTSYTLDLSQLAAGPIVVDAGNGFKIVAIGHRRQAQDCDSGFMRGRWHALSANLGRYLGVVTNEDGDRIGHVRGIYGQRRNGDAVVFGKFIDSEGQFRGLLIGAYEDGRFHARWMDRAGDHGAARGAYVAGPDAGSGQFLGRWAEAGCSADQE